jgi:hypothetical protein
LVFFANPDGQMLRSLRPTKMDVVLILKPWAQFIDTSCPWQAFDWWLNGGSCEGAKLGVLVGDCVGRLVGTIVGDSVLVGIDDG